MMGFGMFGGMFIFWIAIIALAVILVRGLFQSNQSSNNIKENNYSTPGEILEQRYASGEINQEQFLQMKKDLQ
jgi:putative membrane protein